MMPEQGSAYAGAHILLVDDNPDELRLLIERLRGTGYRLSVAFDGAQGYDRAVAGKPDLIVLDVCMPRMNGIAMCMRLKATPATADIPVIFLSSGSDLEQRLQGLYCGGCDYVLKPYSPDEVLARIRIHLARPRPAVAQSQRDESVMSDSDQVLVRAAQHYLREHLADVISLDALARLLGTNEKRLTQAFRRCIGATVFEYLRDQRMKAAKRFLAETSLSVVAISEELGFSTAANFSTAFHKQCGLPPSLFRRSIRVRSASSRRNQ